MGASLGDQDSSPLGDARLAVAAVARRIGVAPATLRTWDRRYGLGPSEHTAGAHRRYTAEDVARLELMQRLLTMGAPPAEAARAALAADPADLGSASQQTAATLLPAARTSAEGSSRRGGGQVVAIPGGTPSARGLARAAMALDSEACAEIIDQSIDRRGVVATWDTLLAPVLIGMGQKWESSGSGVEIEHLLSESVIAVFQGRMADLRHPANHLSVVLACAPDDLHTLPLFATAAALAEHRVSCRILGARVPHDALISAVRRTGPGAVLIWSQTAATGGLGDLGQLAELRPAPAVLLGGPGWDAAGELRSVDSGLERVDDLQSAVLRISRAVCL